MAESLKQFLGKEAVPIFGWTQGVPVEEQAMQQLKNIASMPFIHKHVAVCLMYISGKARQSAVSSRQRAR